MNGTHVEIEWNGRGVAAWMPARLSDMSLILPPDVVRSTAAALADLRLMEHRIPAAADAIGRMLLKSEGIASSAVEGLRVPIENVLAVESLGQGTSEASWVAGNLAIVSDAIADTGRPMNADVLHRWHTRLMGDSPLDPELIGSWRTSPGWIGGTSPIDAVYVPPPADVIESLMQDLMDYVNSGRDDPIAQAAVAQAQFESIHPYGDGNGRIGRVLIGWVLRRRGVVERWPPPISIAIARDSGGYLGGLYQFREGDPSRWVDWLAAVVSKSAGTAGDLFGAVEELEHRWAQALNDVRSDAAAHRVVRILTSYPILSADRVAAELDVSRRSALTALEMLENRSIVAPFGADPAGVGRPRHWWIAQDLVDLVRTFVG